MTSHEAIRITLKPNIVQVLKLRCERINVRTRLFNSFYSMVCVPSSLVASPCAPYLCDPPKCSSLNRKGHDRPLRQHVWHGRLLISPSNSSLRLFKCEGRNAVNQERRERTKRLMKRGSGQYPSKSLNRHDKANVAWPRCREAMCDDLAGTTWRCSGRVPAIGYASHYCMQDISHCMTC